MKTLQQGYGIGRKNNQWYFTTPDCRIACGSMEEGVRLLLTDDRKVIK